MSAPPGPKVMEALAQVPSIQELIKQRADVPTEKPKIQKTVEELEGERRELEVACHAFAGADGKGGVILELTELLKADEQEEAKLIESLGANADLEKELEPARQAREEDRKQIESLKRAYDSLLVQIGELNRQIREAREHQVTEGKREVDQKAEEIEDLTEHAVMEPPPVPFAAREASVRVEERRQAMLAEAPFLTEDAVEMTSPVVNEVTVTTPDVPPAKPEPTAKNEGGPEGVPEAQAFLAEDQREKMEVRQRLLKLYQLYTKELLPQMQGMVDATEKLGAIGVDVKTKEGPFTALARGARMQMDDTKTLQVLFTHLQSEAMGTTPQDIEARTRDTQLLVARLQMRMQGMQGLRNVLLGLRGGGTKGSALEAATVNLDQLAGKAWKTVGAMQTEWQPLGGKVQARNGQEYHKLYRASYGVITSERAKGDDVIIEVPEDVQKGLPKEMIPDKEDLSKIQGEAVVMNLEGIMQERAVKESDKDQKHDELVSEADYQKAIELREKIDKGETTRVEVAQDIMRRTRRVSADLDGITTKEISALRLALGDVLREAQTVVYASSQKDRVDDHQGIIWVYNQGLIEALQHADEAARAGGASLSDDVRMKVRRLASFAQDLPALVESDESEHAKRIVDRFEAQKKESQKIPRIGI